MAELSLDSIRSAARTLEVCAVQNQRHGAVIDELDVHHGAEAPALDAHAERLQAGGEGLDQGLGGFGRRGLVEAGPAASAQVRVESELADHQRFAAAVEQGAIDAPGLVSEFQLFQDAAGDAHDRIELIRVVGEAAAAGPVALRRAGRSLVLPLERDAALGLKRAQSSARKLQARLADVPVEWK